MGDGCLQVEVGTSNIKFQVYHSYDISNRIVNNVGRQNIASLHFVCMCRPM